MATVIDLAWGGSVPGNTSIRPIDPSLTDNFLTSGAEYYEPKRDFNAIGDGSTDDSVAVNLCIAAALAAGHRKMEIAEEYYVPTMSKEAADLIFVGDGSLVSSPVLKPIIPKDASPPRPPLTTFRASQHCPMGSIAAARGEVTIVLMGDSVSTPQVNGVSYIGNFHGKLREAFERDNPGVTINWYNRGIGGMNWDTLPDNHFGTVVQEWYDVNQPWLDYVEDLAPDVVIVSCARNGGSSFQMKHIRDALAIMQGWAKVPDIIMTNSIGETQTEAVAANSREGYLYAAAGIRSYALANGYGLIDTETQFSQLNLGFAQENLPLLRDGSIIGNANTGNYDVVMPWTASVPVYGWGGNFRVGPGDWTTMGNEFSFQIGGAKTAAANGCRFWISRNATTFELSYRITVSRIAEGGSEDYTFVATTATGIICNESQYFSFTFHQQGSRVYLGYLTPGNAPATPVNIANNAFFMFYGYVPRCGGAYSPTITCTAGAASNVLTWTGATDEYASLTQMLHPRALNMPELTDREFASPDIVPLLPWGGGGPHQGTLAAELIIERAIQLNDFSFATADAAPLGIRSSFTSYYTSPVILLSATTAAMIANILYAQPIRLPNSTIDRIGINVTTGAAGACRLGIYSNKDNGTNAGMPDQLLVDCGTVDTTSIAFVEASFTALKLSSRFVWLVAVFNATPTCTIGTGANTALLGASSVTGASRGLLGTFTYGALPTTSPTITGFAAQPPVMYVRKS
jgi:hypothetical protein